MMDVVIVDDEPAARRSLREFCARENDLHIVGEYGDGHIRFSLIENEERTRQALRGIKQMFKAG